MQNHKLPVLNSLLGRVAFLVCLIATTCCGLKAAGSVYLAFDDGPVSWNSATLVNNLKNAGAKATFFIIGNRISGNATAFAAIKNAGFSIQNHSYTHQHMLSWTYQQVYNDLKQCQDAIKAAGGGTPKYFRPPYLEVNATIRSVCSALGLTIVTCSVDSGDWNGASTAQIISACNNLQSGGVTLMHDGYTTTDAAVATVVKNLKARGLSTAQF